MTFRSFRGAARTLFAAGIFAWGALLAGAAERPNFLFFLVDDLGWADIGANGSRYHETPNIDALAAEGALFEQHISSAPWTLPAHAAMFTSVPDSVHGVVDAVRFRLSEDFETLPESFQAAGYRTAGFFAGPYLHPAFGLGQGFDRYVDCVQTVVDDEVDEDNAHALYQRACAWAGLGENDNALRDLQQAVNISEALRRHARAEEMFVPLRDPS